MNKVIDLINFETVLNFSTRNSAVQNDPSENGVLLLYHRFFLLYDFLLKRVRIFSEYVLRIQFDTCPAEAFT